MYISIPGSHACVLCSQKPDYQFGDGLKFVGGTAMGASKLVFSKTKKTVKGYQFGDATKFVGGTAVGVAKTTAERLSLTESTEAPKDLAAADDGAAVDCGAEVAEGLHLRYLCRVLTNLRSFAAYQPQGDCVCSSALMFVINSIAG